jgi:hypothetical protein
MESLYGKLFKYRERQKRSPLEDYLTACLADLFNRLQMGAQHKVAARLFVPALLHGWFNARCASAKFLRMETQHAIPTGRIDLVLYVDDEPLVAIENKIGARVGDDQLVTYGRWIRESVPSDRPAIVCLLTHLTRPPEGFKDGGEYSGKASPHIAKWQRAFEVLNELIETEDLCLDVRTLARELRSFLGECDMSREFAGRDEFAAALVYLRAGSRMDHTFGSIYNHVKSLEGCFVKGESIHESSLLFDTEFKFIWGWKYLNHRMLGGLFFGYGVALEPTTIFRQGAIPDSDSTFICVGAEDRRSIEALRAAKNEPKKPWTYAEIGDWAAIISFRPLHSFLLEPEAFASKMIAWIDAEARDINAFVSELK